MSANTEKKDKNKPVIEPRAIKTTTDLQRLRLEKLMKNPDKPVIIPERPKAKQMPSAPDFVRNVMGSSAGAGSGEFHVYRHLRRKEYARQKFIQEKSELEKMDDEYHNKLEENKKLAEERTAKKRAKRLKKKKSSKVKEKKPKQASCTDEKQSDSESNDNDNDVSQQKSETADRDTNNSGTEDDTEGVNNKK